jgi:nitrate reductase NapE component
VSDENTPNTPDVCGNRHTIPPVPARHLRPVPPQYRAKVETEAAEVDDQAARKEWIKFAVLVVVLFGAIFVVWAVRPLIFGQIVPPC